MSPYRSVSARAPSATGALLLRGDQALPAICLKCGRPDWLVARPVHFRTRPIYVLPLCRHCDERRENARKGLVFTSIMVAMAVLGAPLRAKNVSDLVGVPLVAIVAFTLVLVYAILPRMLRVSEAPEGYLKLAGVHPAVAERLRREVL